MSINELRCNDCKWFDTCGGENNICDEYNPPEDLYINEDGKPRRYWKPLMQEIVFEKYGKRSIRQRLRTEQLI